MRLYLPLIFIILPTVIRADIVVVPADKIIVTETAPTPMPVDFLFVRYDKIILSDATAVRGK